MKENKKKSNGILHKTGYALILFLLVGGIWFFTIKNKGGAKGMFVETESGSFTDARDEKKYDWVLLKDSEKWMASNLNYASKDSWCFDHKPENCEKYGRLYTQLAARGACPKGWHLPDASEWKAMANAYGGYYDMETSKLIGKELESFKTLTENGKGKFEGKFGGFRNADNSFYNLGDEGHYWSRSLAEGNHAWSYYFGRVYGFFRWKDADKSLGFSCRCIKD